MNKLLKELKYQEGYSYFIENHPAIIIISESITGNIIDANKEARKFYGYSEDEFTKLSMMQIYNCNEEELYKEIQNASNQDRNYWRMIHKTKLGEYRNINAIHYEIEYNMKSYSFFVMVESRIENSFDYMDINNFLKYTKDSFCIVDSEEIFSGKVVYFNKSFGDMMGVDKDDLNKIYISDILKEIDNKDLGNREYYGKIVNRKTGNKVAVEIIHIKMRYSGGVYSCLLFNNLKFYAKDIINLKNDIKEAAKSFPKTEGYLVFMEFYLNTKSDKIFSEVNTCLSKKIKMLFDKEDATYWIENIQNDLLIYSDIELSKLLVILNIILNEENCSNLDYFTVYNLKFRISVSKRGKVDDSLVNDIRTVVKTFGDDEYNTIHVSSKKEEYYKSIAIKNDVLAAVLENQFQLYYQNIIDLEKKAVIGIEILVRWQHPKYGIVMPNEFIPYADFKGIVINIDLWVIEHMAEYILQNKEKLKTLKIHVNISSKTLADNRAIKRINELLSEIDIRNIIFEITEYSNEYNIDKNIIRLREQGFKFAIDDFGKGYSSFEKIKDLKIDYIKIDKKFIHNIADSLETIMILKAIISMCLNLGINVIAEGVESLEQIEFLNSKNCKLIQGYLIHEPEPIERMLDNQITIDNHIKELISAMKLNERIDNKIYRNGRILFQDFDTNLNIIQPNIILADYLGYDINSFKKLNINDLIPNKHIDALMKFIEGINGSHKFESLLIRIKAADKNEIEVFFTLQKLENGNCRIFFEFLQEIEEYQNELQGLSSSYIQAFHEAPTGMMILDDVYVVNKWNQRCEEIFGWTAAETININLFKLITDESTFLAMNKMFQGAVANQISEMVIENIDKNQKTHICRWHVRSLLNEVDKSNKFICMVNDITESIKQGKLIAKITKAIDNSQSIIILTDTSGEIEYVNHKFNEITGYSNDEIIGSNISGISHREENRELTAEILQVLRSGKIWEGEFQNKKKDGSFYWIESKIYPVKDDNDELTGFVNISVDITKEKALEESNSSLRTKLLEQDKIAMVGLLTSGIIHEINNPLSYIKENFSYIKEQLEDISNWSEEDKEEIVDAIDDIEEGLSQISNIALGLKKFVFKRENEELEEVDLVDEIKTVLIVTKNEYKYYTTVALNYDKDRKYNVIGNGSKLKQVFMNMIINATQSIVSKEKEGLGKINITLEEVEQWICVKIQDDGCGMDDEVRVRIFEPLFTTKPEGVGTGLGLSVSRQIIEKDHGGKIECESEKDVGTTFSIYIPKLDI